MLDLVINGMRLMEEVMKSYSRHVKATSEMRTFADEVSTAFMPTAEEQLLGVLTYALERCYRSIPDRIADASESLDRLLRFALSQLGLRVRGKGREGGGTDWAAQFASEFFQAHAGLGGGGSSGKGRGSASAAATASATDPHTRLERQVHCLRKWIALLERVVRASVPDRLMVEDYSPKLLSMDLSEMQLHIGAGEPVLGASTASPVHHAGAASTPERISLRQPVERSRPVAPTLQQVLPEMSAVTRNGRRLRRIWMVATNGVRRGYLVESRELGCRERARHLGSVIEFLLSCGRVGREWVTPPYFPADVPVSGHVALVEDDASNVPLGDVLAEHLDGREAGAEPLLTLYLRALGVNSNGTSGGDAPPPSPEAKVRALLALSEGSSAPVSEGVLVGYAHRLFHDPRTFLTFRKTFTSHLANVSALGWALGVSAARPGSLLIQRNLGRVFHTEFWPARREDGEGSGGDVGEEEVPFRLTRNLLALVTPFGMEGTFARTVAGLGSALGNKKGFALSHLTLFLRDDTISWRLHSATDASPPELDSAELMAEAAGRASATMARFARVDPSRRHKASEESMAVDGETSSATNRSHAGAAIQALVQAASSVDALSRKDVGFHPWF